MSVQKNPYLEIDSDVNQRLKLSFEEMAAFPDEDHVRDVSKFDPNRSGEGLKLSAVLDQAIPNPAATHITFHASVDDFAASVPLELILDKAILLYAIGGKPLPKKAGGPIRLVIPNSAPCRTAEIDACANVKFIDRIELSVGKGRDTRR